MSIQHEVVIVPFPEPMYYVWDLVPNAEHKQVYTNIAVCAAYVLDEDRIKIGIDARQYLHGMSPQSLMMKAVNQAFIPVRIADKT